MSSIPSLRCCSCWVTSWSRSTPPAATTHRTQATQHAHLQRPVGHLHPPRTHGPLAGAAGIPLLNPVSQAVPALDLRGMGSVNQPLSNNLTRPMGSATAALVQWPNNGHFAVYEDGFATAMAQLFFQTWADTGTAHQSVDAPYAGSSAPKPRLPAVTPYAIRAVPFGKTPRQINLAAHAKAPDFGGFHRSATTFPESVRRTRPTVTQQVPQAPAASRICASKMNCASTAASASRKCLSLRVMAPSLA